MVEGHISIVDMKESTARGVCKSSEQREKVEDGARSAAWAWPGEETEVGRGE